jgi:Lrp/AsnC family transcriptional regulator, regulator for asnA, asnC and gidA
MAVDDTDRRIIDVLDKDASLTHKEIAQKLRMNESTVRKRIISLTKRKVIRFIIRIDISQLGLRQEAELGLDVEPSKILEVGKALPNIPGVRMVFSTSGNHDYIVVIWAADRDSLQKIMSQVSALDGVNKVTPSLIIERLK